MKGMRDHERFLLHFDTLDRIDSHVHDDIATKAECAFVLPEPTCPGNHTTLPPAKNPTSCSPRTTHPPSSRIPVCSCPCLETSRPPLPPSFSRTALLIIELEGHLTHETYLVGFYAVWSGGVATNTVSSLFWLESSCSLVPERAAPTRERKGQNSFTPTIASWRS
jgi:hypothetical protein